MNCSRLNIVITECGVCVITGWRVWNTGVPKTRLYQPTFHTLVISTKFIISGVSRLWWQVLFKNAFLQCCDVVDRSTKKTFACRIMCCRNFNLLLFGRPYLIGVTLENWANSTKTQSSSFNSCVTEFAAKCYTYWLTENIHNFWFLKALHVWWMSFPLHIMTMSVIVLSFRHWNWVNIWQEYI